jgi:hypothetical protein
MGAQAERERLELVLKSLRQRVPVKANGSWAAWVDGDVVRGWVQAGDMRVDIVAGATELHAVVTTYGYVSDQPPHARPAPKAWHRVDVMRYENRDEAVSQFVGIATIITERR